MYIERARAWCPSVPHPQASPSLFGLSISLEWIGIYLKPKDMWYIKKEKAALRFLYFSIYYVSRPKFVMMKIYEDIFVFLSFFFFVVLDRIKAYIAI